MVSETTIETLRSVDPCAPIRLELAAKLAFPDGSMTASGLRREATRGRLVVERVAGKDYTTLEHIRQMRELCRVRAKETGLAKEAYGTSSAVEGSSSRPSDSTSTAPLLSAQEALRARLQRTRLKNPSK